jgi:rod shape-determining protein MreB
MVRDWKEKHSFVGEPKGQVVVEAPVRGKPTSLEVTAEMRKACESLLAPLSETMLDLLSRVDPEYQQRVRNNIVLAGGGSQIPGLAAALERALEEVGGGKVRVVEDPVYAGATGSLVIAADAPEGDWERLAG